MVIVIHIQLINTIKGSIAYILNLIKTKMKTCNLMLTNKLGFPIMVQMFEFK